MHAKHIYHSILIIAAAGATACSSESNAPEPAVEAQELSFQANTDTRASVVTTMNTPFEVYGEFATTGDPAASHTQLFNATPVSLSGGKWTYGTPEYWMPGNTYSFIALHPAPKDGAGVTGLTNKAYNIDSQQLSFTYTLPDNYTDATDLLAATHRRQYNLGPTPTTPVSLNFTHLLARLNFIARVDVSADDPVTIYSLTLQNVGTKGTYTIKPAGLVSGTETDDYEGGWTVEAPSGEEANPTRLFEISGEGNDCLPQSDLTITPGLSRPLFRPYAVAAADAADEKDHPANPLFILPQEVNPKTEMVIEYRVGNSELIQATANLYSITVGAHRGIWEKGKSYTYSFTLGADEFIIYSQPTVEDWNFDEGGNYVIID